MLDTLNKEGLTFYDWVCAAGVFNGSWQYSESSWGHRYSENCQCKGKVHKTYKDRDGVRCCEVRNNVVYYRQKYRKAWRDGEDPTEWRK